MYETGRMIDSIAVRFGLCCLALIFELWREELICISVWWIDILSIQQMVERSDQMWFLGKIKVSDW